MLCQHSLKDAAAKDTRERVRFFIKRW